MIKGLCSILTLKVNRCKGKRFVPEANLILLWSEHISGGGLGYLK